jgi:hypothetical protein
MADFCKQCSVEIFGDDFGELADMCKPGQIILTICEGCGPVQVDHEGTCVSKDCIKKHGEAKHD